MDRAIACGGSAGGLAALSTVLESLPQGFAPPILVVLHRPAVGGENLPRLLRRHCVLDVKEAEDKESLRSGRVYLAPPDYHLLVEYDRTLSLSVEEKVCYARPSIDVLFETAAEVFGAGLVGLLLSGANHDGRAGLQRIRELGGVTAVQEPSTASSSQMPQSAIDAGVVEHVLGLAALGRLVVDACSREGSR
jgi:two-component system chemotaxis response regulator CheB